MTKLKNFLIKNLESRTYNHFKNVLLEFEKSKYFNEYKDKESEIKNILSQTAYWHGTGRYLYKFDNGNKYTGNVIGIEDVLINILKCEKLETHADPFIQFEKGKGIIKINTVSDTTSEQFIALADYRIFGLSFGAIPKNYNLDKFINKISSDINYFYKVGMQYLLIKNPKYIYIYTYNIFRKSQMAITLKKWCRSYKQEWYEVNSWGKLLKSRTDI